MLSSTENSIRGVRYLLLIPPMTQLNTPYPSTAYLTGFLRSQGLSAVQEDLALALVLRLLSADGLRRIAGLAAGDATARQRPATTAFLSQLEDYISTIDRVISFLQGRDSTLAHRIAARALLPEGPRFASLDVFEGDEESGEDSLAWAFGALGVQDRARHLCTLYLSDLADVIRESIDERFEFVRYAESLAASQPSFDQLAHALQSPTTLLDDMLQELTEASMQRHQPQVVLLTVPFPGTVYASFRIAQTIRQRYPQAVLVLGGGYVNTELRELCEPRVFDYFDFVMLDAGERPLLALDQHLRGQRSREQLSRAYFRDAESGEVRYVQGVEPDVPFAHTGTPTWDGLPLPDYLSTLDMLNPMHRLWSDGRWNKLTVAHGCYWKKCSFCDVTLDYISRYDAPAARVLADRIEAIVAETGQTGFHFVDEAAPPKGLRALAEEILSRGLRNFVVGQHSL